MKAKTKAIHPWHDISVGDKAPKIVNMIIEIPKGSRVKYELDKKTGMLRMDRYMYSAVHYPGDYGFIPQTLWEDNDPMDVMIITNEPTYPLTICEVKVIGVIRMIDEDEEDDKIIAVHAGDPRYSEWTSIKDVPQHFLKELEHFLETYKDLQGKKVKVYRTLGPTEAFKDIKKARQMYDKRYKKTRA